MNAQKVFGIVGWKNSGKTTLVEAVIRELTGRGLRISTIKHAHHGFDIDVPGKDSFRHREAGATQVLIASSRRWALMHEHREEPAPDLPELLACLAPCDLVLVEGFKSGPHRKIEVVRAGADGELLADRDATICAVATDRPSLAGRHLCLPLNDASAVADYICTACDLPA